MTSPASTAAPRPDSVAQMLANATSTLFSFEILPPLRGKSIEGTYKSIDRLMEFAPAYVNITTHRNEVVYVSAGEGIFRTVTTQRRPGSVAIAAAIRGRYGVRPVPHIICGEYSTQEIENQLIDLAYLGITDVLALRGDTGKGSKLFTTDADGHLHAEGLCRQITDFNSGRMADGTVTDDVPAVPFTFGVAGYPEKHEEAMNRTADLEHLRAKVEAGAGYVVTQMFFDNSKYFRFVDECRAAGITVPIVPGLKPITSLKQMSLLPKTFHIDLPEPLAREFVKCRDNDQAKALGIEWTTAQARELKAHGVPCIHFYSMNAAASVAEIARKVY